MSPEAVRSAERERQLCSLMSSIVEWAVGNLGQAGSVIVNAIFFEGKSVRQHCEEECVSLRIVYKCV